MRKVKFRNVKELYDSDGQVLDHKAGALSSMFLLLMRVQFFHCLCVLIVVTWLKFYFFFYLGFRV